MRAKNNPLRRGQDPFAGREHPRGMAGKVASNRGKTWEAMYPPQVVDSQRRGAATRMKAVREALTGSPEREQARRAKLSIVAKERGLGGYACGSGRGKKGWYRGFWCDSTYELAFVVWAVDHEIPFERNLELFPYEYQGQVLHWMPDFLLADGTYIEIKGYLSNQARAKFEYFLRPLAIFTRTDLSRMFDYAHQHCGRNLVAVYE
jgi:hypothetical protein